MIDEDRLAEVALELAGRVRDYDPESNARWLAAELSDPVDWFRLNFVFAIGFAVDRSWGDLTAWIDMPVLSSDVSRDVSRAHQPKSGGRRRKHEVDEIAVERALHGDRTVRLTVAERRLAIEKLLRRGAGTNAISRLLGVSGRTVVEVRKKQEAA